MNFNKELRRKKIRLRIRKKIFGTQQSPRISVFRSNKAIYAQVIDDIKGKTLAFSSSMEKEIVSKKITKVEEASLVGKMLAKRCIDKGIKKCSFDRGGYLYHGRVKSLAEGAREGGLEF